MFYKTSSEVSKARRNFYIFCIIVFFGILFARFYSLQIQKYEKYLERSEKNRIRELVLDAPRGLIFDRNYFLLVDNRPSYSIFVIPWEVNQTRRVYPLLGRYLNMDELSLREKVKRDSKGAFIPVKVKGGIDFENLSKIEENKLDLPGVVYQIEHKRFYPASSGISHIVGYIREIDEEELKKMKFGLYEKGDIIGWKGIERQYESILKGKKGYKYVQVDAYGREIGDFPEKKEIYPVPGSDLILTIDLSLQTFVNQLMNGKKGVIIVLDPSTGEILAMVSKPDFPPQLFSGNISEREWSHLINDPDNPLYNRATQGTYPPGSTFKLISAIAAVEEKVIDLDWIVNCKGYYKLGIREFKDWKEGGHGKVNLLSAIEQSCNVYFYELSLKLGVDLWSEYAGKLGFGDYTGIDIPEEKRGIVPTREFLDNKYGKGKWTRGNLLNLAVGQGDLVVTPIQMAVLTMILANDGKYFTPHFLKAFKDENGDIIPFEGFQQDSVKGISKRTFEIVREGMLRVVHGEKGTGRLAQNEYIKIYGKTGTAQNPHGEDHAWFIGYTKPGDNPIAFVVFLENEGFGGAKAAPIAGEIVKFYYRNLMFAHLEN